MRRKLKVCGITTNEQVKALEALKDVDFIGFIFYEKSPRHALNFKPVAKTSPDIKRVGVFVNSDYTTITSMVDTYAIDHIQLHGSESTAFCEQLLNENFSVSKAFGISSTEDLKALSEYDQLGLDHFVLDTKTAAHGGSGMQYDWNILADYPYATPFLLSGGIRPEDAAQLNQLALPKCIGYDINSRFETAPGIKSIPTIQTFIKQLL